MQGTGYSLADLSGVLLLGMQVGQLVRNFTDQAVALGQVVLQDGKWHMLTLTTLWDGNPGYAMLVDGQLAGVLNGNYTYTGICSRAAQLPSGWWRHTH